MGVEINLRCRPQFGWRLQKVVDVIAAAAPDRVGISVLIVNWIGPIPAVL